ncbi:hypothetical protein HY498_04020 [Candidatus Woesearchaeota archaeon]|nr:hypothetical protein [Candidatus Woesearchaeota archaeon]
MAKRKKRLIKQEKGLLRQAEKHRLKLITEKGRKDTTHEYWKKEILKFEEQVRERARLLEKLKRKKGR